MLRITLTFQEISWSVALNWSDQCSDQSSTSLSFIFSGIWEEFLVDLGSFFHIFVIIKPWTCHSDIKKEYLLMFYWCQRQLFAIPFISSLPYLMASSCTISLSLCKVYFSGSGGTFLETWNRWFAVWRVELLRLSRRSDAEIGSVWHVFFLLKMFEPECDDCPRMKRRQDKEECVWLP